MYIDEYIQAIINNIDRGLSVLSATVNGADTDIILLDNRWLSLFNYVLINDVLVRIKAFDLPNKKITVEGNFLDSDILKIPDTVFFVGSRMVSSSEWLLYSNDYKDKVPFVWLNFPSNILERRQEDNVYLSEWENLRLFFVSDADRSQWISKETIELRTRVLRIWVQAFIQSVRFPLEIIGDVTQSAHPIFGIEQADGAVEDFFNGNLSAVSVAFNFGVLGSCESQISMPTPRPSCYYNVVIKENNTIVETIEIVNCEDYNINIT